MNQYFQISKNDSLYIDQMRGISIIRVVLGHLGLFWIFPPYSEFFMSLLPLLFFTSGAVSALIYSRAKSTKSYLQKRFIGLLAPFYLVSILSFFILLCVPSQEITMSINTFINWILLNPPRSSMPYPLGQTWFLHALAIILFISPLIFYLMKKSRFYALIPISISLALGLIQLLYPINKHLYLFGHNLYQPLSNAGFFFFGALFYSLEKSLNIFKLLTFFVISLATAITIARAPATDIGLASHSFSPDLYYLSVSFAAIFLILIAQPLLQAFLAKVKPLNLVILYASKHSYAIFLIHTFFIFAIEKWLGLKGVMGDPLRALIKISIVLAATFIIAPAITHTSKKLSKIITDYLSRVQDKDESKQTKIA